MERAAKECHASAYRLSAGKSRDSLIYYRLEYRGGKVCLCRALVYQRLNVCLCKNSASCRDRIYHIVVLRLAIKSLGICLKERRHLIDKRSRAARANAVHSLLKAAREVYYLRILAAKLDSDVGLGCYALERGGDRHHLLNEAYSQRIGEVESSRARDLDLERALSDALSRLRCKSGKHLSYLRSVTSVFSKYYFVFLVDYDELCRGRAYINTRAIGLHYLTCPSFDFIYSEKILIPILTDILFYHKRQAFTIIITNFSKKLHFFAIREPQSPVLLLLTEI